MLRRLAIAFIVVLLAMVAIVLAATPAAADPPMTDYLYFEVTSENVWSGFEARTGVAFHSWDWVWKVTTVSDDPRFDGYEYIGPGRTNCLWSRLIDPAGTCVFGGDIVIIATVQPLPDSYWEGRFMCPQDRACKAEMQGHGAFEGLRAIQQAVMVPGPR